MRYLAAHRYLLLAVLIVGAEIAMPDPLAGAVIALSSYALGYLACLARDYFGYGAS